MYSKFRNQYLKMQVLPIEKMYKYIWFEILLLQNHFLGPSNFPGVHLIGFDSMVFEAEFLKSEDFHHQMHSFGPVKK